MSKELITKINKLHDYDFLIEYRKIEDQHYNNKIINEFLSYYDLKINIDNKNKTIGLDRISDNKIIIKNIYNNIDLKYLIKKGFILCDDYHREENEDYGKYEGESEYFEWETIYVYNIKGDLLFNYNFEDEEEDDIIDKVKISNKFNLIILEYENKMGLSDKNEFTGFCFNNLDLNYIIKHNNEIYFIDKLINKYPYINSLNILCEGIENIKYSYININSLNMLHEDIKDFKYISAKNINLIHNNLK